MNDESNHLAAAKHVPRQLLHRNEIDERLPSALKLASNQPGARVARGFAIVGIGDA
jgi:hypothetical protein